MTVPLRFPLPSLQGILSRLSGKKWFATLDLKSGYHQIPSDPGSQPLTAFVTESGQFEFTRVPFGLKNAPAFFQSIMVNVLSGLVLTKCDVYIDDIVVYGCDSSEFLSNLAEVFSRIYEASIVLRADKCKVGLQEVEYLGHVASGKGIRMSDSRKSAVDTIKPPRTKTRPVLSLDWQITLGHLSKVLH